MQENKISKIHTGFSHKTSSDQNTFTDLGMDKMGLLNELMLSPCAIQVPTYHPFFIHLHSESEMKSKSYFDLVSVVFLVTDFRFKESSKY
jgi:hypothetical protein